MPRKTTETIVELGRLNALTDGIYAVALTILAFGLTIPDAMQAAELPDALVRLAPKVLIYLISFIVIGGAWGSHQRMLSQIRRGDGPLVWLDLLSLLFVTLLPACAALLGKFPGEMLAIVCFAADVILIQLSALWLWNHASTHDLLNASLDPRVVRSVGRRLILIAAGFALFAAGGVWNISLAYIGWIGLFVFMFATDWLSWQQVTRATKVAIPLDGAASGYIEVLHTAGQLNIQDSAGEGALVQGTLRGDADTRVTRDGDTLRARLSPRSGRGLISWHFPWAWESPEMDWDLSLNPHIPLSIHIEAGSGDLDLDFSRTHLADLRLMTGTGSVTLRLPEGAGQTAVHIQTGVVALTIHVPPEAAARIHAVAVQPGLDVDLTRFPLSRDGKEFRSKNYDLAANRVEIHLDRGTGPAKII